jgi:hypothetical protein
MKKYKQINQQLRSCGYNIMFDKVWNQVDRVLWGNLWRKLWGDLSDHIWYKLKVQLWDQIEKEDYESDL